VNARAVPPDESPSHRISITYDDTDEDEDDDDDEKVDDKHCDEKKKPAAITTPPTANNDTNDSNSKNGARTDSVVCDGVAQSASSGSSNGSVVSHGSGSGSGSNRSLASLSLTSMATPSIGGTSTLGRSHTDSTSEPSLSIGTPLITRVVTSNGDAAPRVVTIHRPLRVGGGSTASAGTGTGKTPPLTTAQAPIA
jgi:hypothetical protein